MKAFFSIILTITGLTDRVSKVTHAVPAATVNTTVTHTTQKPALINSAVTYLALGDSYTIGQSVALTQSFPYQLKAQLGLKNNPAIIATTGWTTADLIQAISSNKKTYDFVTLLIGVNDQFQGMSADGYRVRFKQLLHTAITFARGYKTKVFVLSIPDYGVTPFTNGDDSTIGPEIAKFNAINKAESAYAGVNYLDITGISKQAANDASLIAYDGLHPSGKMYGLWVERLASLVKIQLVK